MLYSLLLVAATALTSVSAQNYSTSGPLTINVTQVPYTLRQSWCVGEKETCPPVCGGSVTAGGNECDPMTLNYTCTCSSGAKPNLTDYLNTMPNYICIQWRINCVANHPNDAGAQAACHSVICGTKNATTNEQGSPVASASGGLAVPLTSSASPSQSTSAGSMSTSASATSASASATHSGLAAAVKIGGEYGTPVLALGMLAAFGLGI